MVNDKWLYCSEDYWFDVVNIIKLEKNPEKRLREFYRILGREDLTIAEVISEWAVIEKSDIMKYVNEWFYNDDIQEGVDLGYVTYWFFNICTGEAVHIKYLVNISCSGIVTH